eukprot:784271-Prymnesium_polylepis.1
MPGYRSTWTAQGDYLLDLSTTPMTYLVPEAPQSREALEHRLTAHHMPKATWVEPAPRFILPH